jgi:ABC-type Fe3+/spermidine/putrescine transport system ATPase subunit
VTHTRGDDVGIDVSGVGKMFGTPISRTVEGDDVDVVIRPEHIKLRDAADAPVDGSNRLQGVIEAVVIVGGLDRKVLLRLANGDIVEVLVRSEEAREFRIGEAMAAVWSAANTLVLAEPR